MEFSIGDLKVTGHSLSKFNDSRKITALPQVQAALKARPLCKWDCTPPGTWTPKKEDKMEMPTHLRMIQLDAQGKFDRAAATAMRQRFIRATGKRTGAEVLALLNQTFTKKEATVPYNEIWDPFKADYKLTIIGQPLYEAFLLRPIGGNITDYYILQVPNDAIFTSVVWGHCGTGDLKKIGETVGSGSDTITYGRDDVRGKLLAIRARELAEQLQMQHNQHELEEEEEWNEQELDDFFNEIFPPEPPKPGGG